MDNTLQRLLNKGQHQARLAMLQRAGEQLEMAEESAKWAEDKDTGLAGVWDHDVRTRVIDDDGVVAEVLFVDGLTEQNSPPFGGDLGPQSILPGVAVQAFSRRGGASR